jgi:hypothetical protein
MNLTWTRRRISIVIACVLALVALALLAARLAMQQLPAVVAQALGPRASVQSIGLGWTGVEVRGLVLRAEPGRWPAADELRAERVTIRPALSSLWRPGWDLAQITVEGGYLSLLRGRDGRLQVLPSLLGRPPGARAPAAPSQPAPRLHIASVALREVALDMFDASVTRGAPHRLRLTRLRADVGPLALPGLDESMSIDLQAAFKGVQRDGRLALAGRLLPATREAELRLDAQGIDLVALQPYLLKSGESSVKSGTLDLKLRAKAAQQQLQAPGSLVLHQLELQSEGLLATFGGVPRQAVLAAMSRDGKIELDFTLEGRLDDPKFSINELFAARFAVGLAEKLGVSVGGVVEGVGNVIKGLFGK